MTLRRLLGTTSVSALLAATPLACGASDTGTGGQAASTAGAGGASGNGGSSGSKANAGNTGKGGFAAAGNGGAGAGGNTGAGGAAGSNGGGGGSGGSSGAGGSGGAGGAASLPIGEWTDAPGTCPVGMPRVDITTSVELASAARGQDAFANDAPATCYFVHNGTYSNANALLYILQGGDPGGKHRIFVGESRAGVVLNGRGSIEDGVSDVTVSNLTFDLAGYAHPGAFNTLGLGNGKNIVVDHVTFTGDCATGSTGGHIETNGTTNVVVEACLIEKFGHCGANGHLDHGVYLASGSAITLRNNVIRLNASRGIQMYTAGGSYGTLDGIVVEQNRVFENGHQDQEDGIVINAYGTGTIKNVAIRRNVFHHNFFSAIRFAGGLESAVVIEHNTFDHDGSGSTSSARSEINIDVPGGGAGTKISGNVFSVGYALINDCYDDATLGFGLGGDFVLGPIPAGAQGNCVAPEVTGDPKFVNAPQGDYHTQNPAAAAFGAYAP